MPKEAYREAARLVASERWAALGTLNDGAPLVSMVSYAVESGMSGLLMLLSPLSVHTRNLLEDPRASLAISRPDNGEGDPQELARITLSGTAIPLHVGSEGLDDARAVYESRFEGAGPRLQLPDLILFRFIPEGARYVGGFGRALSLSAARLREVAAEG